jgi:general secretion pathway protein K
MLEVSKFILFHKHGLNVIRRHSSSTGRSPYNRGFALIIVLWSIVLLSEIIFHITASGRTELKISSNIVANTIAREATDGAIFQTIFRQSAMKLDQRWVADGGLHEIVIGETRINVKLEDEASLINPNSASPALVEALLRATGSDSATASKLATAISEWTGTVSVARPRAIVMEDYQNAGLDYGPPGEAMETLDELGQVLGMTPAVLASIRPHLTLFGPPEPSATSADDYVAIALAEARAQLGGSLSQPPPDVFTTRITAIGYGPKDARVTRAAIVRFGTVLPSGYAVLAWGDGF